MRWTLEQQEVISARNSEVLVSAAAGSGKTAVLAQRVADMVIHDELSMEELLVLTFTRASAADMREKIITALMNAAGDESLSTRVRERCVIESQHITLAQISTIDSYCNRIVRENFPLVQINPDYGICEDEDAQKLLEESMRLTLDEYYENAEQSENAKAFIESYSTKEVSAIARTVFKYVMARPDPEKWLQMKCSAQNVLQSPAESTYAAAIDEAYTCLWVKCESLQRKLQQLVDSGELTAKEKYQKLCSESADQLESLRTCIGTSPRRWYQTAIAVKWPRMVVCKKKAESEIPLVEKIKEVHKQIHEITEAIKKVDWMDEQHLADLKNTAQATEGLRELVLLLIKNNREVKQQANLLEFSDIEQFAHRLLSVSDVCAREQKKAKAIFVDEYQDVSPLQEDILQKLKHEGASIFYVGDVKQSIYRFRNAQPKNFLHKLKNFSDEANARQRRMMLTKNFRSGKSVLDAANRVMEGILRENLTELRYDEKARLHQGRQMPVEEKTQLYLLPKLSSEENDDADSYREIYAAAKLLQSMRKTEKVFTENGERQATYGDFAVIMPKSSHAAAMQSMLSLMNIQSQNERAVSFYEKREIRDLTEFLTLMDHPSDEEAFYCVLRSWLFGFTADEITEIRVSHPRGSLIEAAESCAGESPNEALRKKLRTVSDYINTERYRIHNSNLFHYLWDFVRRTGLYEQCRNEADGNATAGAIDRLLFEAMSFEEHNFKGIDAFAQKLRDRCESRHVTPLPPDRDSPNEVHIMTVHKSKGLQFPFVFLIGLGDSMKGKNETAPVRLHDELGVALYSFDQQLRVYRETPLWHAIKVKTNAEERAECARLLYVALTRASQRNILFGTGKPIDEIAPETTAQDVLSAKTYLDWLRACVRPGDRLDGETTGKPCHKNDSPWEIFHITQPEAVNPFREKAQSGQAPALPAEIAEIPVPWGPNPMELKPYEYEKHLTDYLTKLDNSNLPRSVTPSGVNRALKEGLRLPETHQEILKLKRIPEFEPKPAAEIPVPELREPDLSGDISNPETTARQRGTATHRLLQLCSYDSLRTELPTLPRLSACLQKELDKLLELGQITRRDHDLADVRMAAKFFLHDLGQRALKAKKCYREKNFFCHYLPPNKKILLRGSMDLCFYDEEEEPGWVIIDYKTDYCKTPGELLDRYRGQLQCYLQGIRLGTGEKIKTCALFSLRNASAIELQTEKAGETETAKEESY